jgi:hypothetical protein
MVFGKESCTNLLHCSMLFHISAKTIAPCPPFLNTHGRTEELGCSSKEAWIVSYNRRKGISIRQGSHDAMPAPPHVLSLGDRKKRGRRRPAWVTCGVRKLFVFFAGTCRVLNQGTPNQVVRWYVYYKQGRLIIFLTHVSFEYWIIINKLIRLSFGCGIPHLTFSEAEAREPSLLKHPLISMFSNGVSWAGT